MSYKKCCGHQINHLLIILSVFVVVTPTKVNGSTGRKIQTKSQSTPWHYLTQHEEYKCCVQNTCE